MATKRGSTTGKITKREANAIYRSLNVDEPAEIPPTRTLDGAINDIYLQAHRHRDRLVTFYVIYTVVFSVFVATLIMFQAAARTVEGKETIELVPQWALNLLVAGMFGQFISLLTIVTKKVWTFEPFLQHHLNYKGDTKTNKPAGEQKTRA